MSRVVITGLGIDCPIGRGAIEAEAALRAGAHGIGAIGHFDGTPFAGMVGGALPRQNGSIERGEAALTFGVAAATEALREAGRPADGERLGFIIGTTVASKEVPLATLADRLRARMGQTRAMSFVVSTACTSSAAAIAFAKDLLKLGAVDRVIAGGMDEIGIKAFAGFHSLGLIARSACTPFGETVGATLGEGAAFFVLELEENARRHRRRVRGVLLGVGTASDAYHPTSPHPSGDGLSRAARDALRDADIAVDSIDWVSAHGTGTAANDASEMLAVVRTFGERVVPVSAQKSLVGHSLGAASAVELALALLAMRQGIIPSTHGDGSRVSDSRFDLVRSPRSSESRIVLKLSAAFGGANAALVVAGGDELRSTTGASRPRRQVYVTGAGAMGGDVPVDDPMGELSDFRTTVGRFEIEALLPGVEPRGLDLGTKFLMVAARRTLDRAKYFDHERDATRTGIFVGQRFVSPSSHLEFEASARERGLPRVSASAFTRKVLNAATGAASRAFGLRGPTSTVSAGRSSGLLAVALGAEELSMRQAADFMLCGALEENDAEEQPAVAGEGAAMVALADSRGASEGIAVRLAGWAVSGPDEVSRATDLAMGRAGCLPEEIERFSPPENPGVPAVAGLLSLGLAIRAIEHGRTRAALVSESGPLVSVALVLMRDTVAT